MITTGSYRLLHKYLDQRYADMVVLTFRQIEDLLGFSLPARARTDSAWWTDAAGDADALKYSEAWTLAHRTARPNLPAGHVAFERIA